VLLSTGVGVWVGSTEILPSPPGEAGGFRFHPLLPSQAAGAERFANLERFEFTKEMIMTTATETVSVPRINDTAPDFTAETTQGTIHFHDWIGNGWAILFSHPKDFTPVCTTELGTMAHLQPEFAKRNVKIIGLSVDPVTNHTKWAADIEETQGAKVNYPMIGDPQLKIAKLYGMLPAESGTTSEGRTAADNATVRTVFVVGPDKKIKLQLSYPMSTGRNFDEVLRVLDSMQLTAKHKVATPVNWKQGDDVIILPAVSNDEAQQKYPGGWKSPKPYLRIVPQPK
jgi:alkyl hydroperoxide reductase subunit AhpC